MTPLNIVMLNDNAYTNGGAAKVAIMEANGLAERGHNVIFIACDAGGEDKPRELHPDIALHCTGQKEIADTNPLTASVQGIRNSQAIKLVNKVLRSCNANNTVVHLHTWNKALSAAVLPVILRHNLPLICTLHDFTMVCPNGDFYNHPRKKICHLRPMSAACIASNCDSRNYAHKLWRVTRCYTQQHWYGMPRRLSHLLTPSRFAKRILDEHLPAGCTLDVLENPIECQKESPVDVGSNNRVLYVGRISPEKGVRLFLQAAQQAGIQPTIVGDGPEAAQLQQDFPDTEFLGWQPADKVKAIMRTARTLVFPSLWYECDPLIIKEAISMGIPIITSDACAATETVIDRQTGLHFRSGDSTTLEHAMQEMFQNSQQAASMGQAAYERFWTTPSTIERHLEKLETHYDKMCAT